MTVRVILVIAALLLPLSAGAGVASIWAVGDGEKIARDARASAFKARNAVWDGRRVSLFGARNEILAFQVIVEADAKGIGALSLALPRLRQRGGPGQITYVPPGADPSSVTASRCNSSASTTQRVSCGLPASSRTRQCICQ